MDDAPSLLLDLPGFRVVSVVESAGLRRVVVVQQAAEHSCPTCGGLVGGRAYEVRGSRVTDLPMGPRPVQVGWRKRRYRCPQPRCPQRVFTERSGQVPPRHRLTARLGARLERAASRSVRALS